MSTPFNDSAINAAEDDRYGVLPFAQAIAKSILSIKEPIGTTIAINGQWGSGKSSTVNLVRRELEKTKEYNLVITEFKCWWYRGEDALALSFLQNLQTVLKASFGDKIKDLVPSMARQILQAGPVLGPAVAIASGNPLAALVTGGAGFLKTFFPDGESIEKIFGKLAKVLKDEKRRFLIIIDDIDRLSGDEALAVFRIVKSFGHLPNVMYLLVFDRDLAEKAIYQKHSSEGPHFLEKIVQAGFDLPTPLQTDLNNAVLSAISEICKLPSGEPFQRFMNIFYDVVVPYITTPRHVARLRNTVSVTWPAIENEVNLADFVAFETLRLYEPALVKAIRLQKHRVCGVRQNGDADQRSNARFDSLLRDVPEGRHENAIRALQRLFPRLEATGYGAEWIQTWDAERRVCVPDHFDTYFRLSLSEGVLASGRIDQLVKNAGDVQFIANAFREAALTERRDGTSMVPVYLDELTTHAHRVEKNDVLPLMSSLFKIHDEIDLEKDAAKGFGAIANTSLRFHWLIRRLTRDRFSIDERSDLYLSATETAAIGWLVDFAHSAKDQYRERDGGPIREENCLVTKKVVEVLIARALDAIHANAANASLLLHQDLRDILYYWRSFNDGNPAEARAWTDSLIGNDEVLVTFARVMTGRSWSAGIGGFGGSLGDRVATPSAVAVIADDTDILDIGAFRTGLERIRDERKLNETALETVSTFLDAWDREPRR